MEKNSTTFEGYQKLASAVIVTAWEDLRTDEELAIIRAKKDELDEIDPNKLTKPQMGKRRYLSDLIILDGESRCFFSQRNYEIWAQVLDMDFDVIYEQYIKFIDKPLEITEDIFPWVMVRNVNESKKDYTDRCKSEGPIRIQAMIEKNQEAEIIVSVDLAHDKDVSVRTIAKKGKNKGLHIIKCETLVNGKWENHDKNNK